MSGDASSSPEFLCCDLTDDQISRYSRHLLMPEVGVKGQEKLCKSSVLIIGAGGLASTAALYLAGAGIGRIGIVDFDTVDSSNLQRQIIHSEARVGVQKAESAKIACLALNSTIRVDTYNDGFTEENGLDLVEQYDVIVDASDNVRTRYLVNDACVLSGKPLVSGSALRMEGQLTVYHHENGPCYRCLFPRPPPPETVTNCSDGGVLGVIPGIIGSLQALEVQKLIMGLGETLSQKLLLFDGMRCRFRSAVIRGRDPNCAICGDSPTVSTLQPFLQHASCEQPLYVDRALPAENQISIDDFSRIFKAKKSEGEEEDSHMFVDVRAEHQYQICSLPGFQNIPLPALQNSRTGVLESLVEKAKAIEGRGHVYVLCRRGIASQQATELLLKSGITNAIDVNGGLTAWKNAVDSKFPLY